MMRFYVTKIKYNYSSIMCMVVLSLGWVQEKGFMFHFCTYREMVITLVV